MQTVAPAAALHDTSCLLVDDLHLSVDDHVLVVLVKHTVGLQQLLEGMYTLRLHGIVVEHLVFLVEALLIAETGLSFQGGEL